MKKVMFAALLLMSIGANASGLNEQQLFVSVNNEIRKAMEDSRIGCGKVSCERQVVKVVAQIHINDDKSVVVVITEGSGNNHIDTAFEKRLTIAGNKFASKVVGFYGHGSAFEFPLQMTIERSESLALHRYDSISQSGE